MFGVAGLCLLGEAAGGQDYVWGVVLFVGLVGEFVGALVQASAQQGLVVISLFLFYALVISFLYLFSLLLHYPIRTLTQKPHNKLLQLPITLPNPHFLDNPAHIFHKPRTYPILPLLTFLTNITFILYFTSKLPIFLRLP